ncbi:peptidase S8 [candidate division KSB3 bacterium]|uniref:Peptidase S8 n=1 Tax=candidate division KSB3 bacterium TaxID=2044937 RepID=A0A2G6EAH8_9BACT|nr:MAG: peptidase S8 [candidate division KSB3 bacterium]PIE30763.1 MAG: peptidase S8 [candidate division KSB3 bacterium]
MKQMYTGAWLLMLSLLLGFSEASVAAKGDFDEIIVNFGDRIEQETIQRIGERYGIALEFNSIFSREENIMRFPVGDMSPDECSDLMRVLTDLDAVEYAEPNYLYQTYLTPDDPRYYEQWNMQMIDMEDAWEEADGHGAIVAVIDTGVAYEDYQQGKKVFRQVPDLATTTFVPGYDFVEDDEHPNDENAHGTHVTGTIAQSTHNKVGVAGIAYNASIMPLKVLNRYGFGNIADIAEAVSFAADHGAHVINMSLGGGAASRLMRDAIAYAHQKGVTIICAAGNEGRSRASYPAAYPYAIGVAGVGPDGRLAPYSNYGSGTDIAAPGGNTRERKEDGILQNTIGRAKPLVDTYEYFQGTSMAAPHVAGVAALLVSVGVKEPEAIEKILLESADSRGDSAKFGAGIVNAAAAVRLAKDLNEEAEAKNRTASSFNFRESMLYFLAGVGFAIAYFKLLKRSDGYGKLFSFLFSLAMLLSSSGLFVLQWLPRCFLPSSWVHVLSSPFANLDRIFGGASCSAINPFFHSALLPFVLIVALLGMKRGKVFAVGFTLGMASHLFVDTFFSLANVIYIPGTFLFDKLWLLGNGVLCFVLAVFAGKTS